MSADSKRPLFLAIQFINSSVPVKLIMTGRNYVCPKSRRIIGVAKTRPCEAVVSYWMEKAIDLGHSRVDRALSTFLLGKSLT